MALRSQNLQSSPDGFLIEADVANVCQIGGEILALSQRFMDPACELAIIDAVKRIIRSKRSDKVMEVMLLKYIDEGWQTVAALSERAEVGRERISKILGSLERSGRITSKLAPPAGNKGGRPVTIYQTTTIGKHYFADAAKRYREMIPAEK